MRRCVAGVFSAAWAADPPAAKPATGAPSVDAASRIVAVTVYSSNALVTREVDTPAVQGAVELVVGPLPPSTVVSSLYSESTDGIRVMSTRYRTRVVQENTQEEVRKLEARIKELKQQEQDLQKQSQTIETNVSLLAKLEGFTAGSLKELTEKGMLKAEEITALVKFIMETRGTSATQSTQLAQKLAALAEQQGFLQREMSKVSTGSDKTIREAVIVIDSDKAAAGKVKFNYLVSAANWRPQYKLRAAKDKPEVTLEYIAAITQQSGEDWTGVDLVLSTAQPMLNANPPELASLEVNVAMAKQAQITVNGGTLNLKDAGANYSQALQLRNEGQSLFNTSNKLEANRRFNDAAAFVQSDEIMNPDAPLASQSKLRPQQPPAVREGQSVTFHLDRKLSVPWRDDEQIIEVARATYKPDYFYKAVPVLTPHVYRLATLTNDSKLVILPGEATMYVGTDVVGRATLPLVAIGEQFTA
ncbi:MAG: mucoidy inhibitor MuiA family protein, partial [Tepidisphaerales bacterium]